MRVRHIPHVELVRNSLLAQDAIELLILREALVVPSSGQHVRIGAKAIEEPRIFEPGQVVRGQMEVAILVVVAVEKGGEVESAGHGEKSAEKAGMAQGDVHRVVAAEAAAKRQQARVAIFLADEGHHFVENIGLVVHVAGDAAARRDLAVVPALAIDGVDAKELKLAGVDPVGETRRPCRGLQTRKSGRRRWENQDRHAGMAKDEQLHGAAEAAGFPFVIFPVHALRPMDSTGSGSFRKRKACFVMISSQRGEGPRDGFRWRACMAIESAGCTPRDSRSGPAVRTICLEGPVSAILRCCDVCGRTHLSGRYSVFGSSLRRSIPPSGSFHKKEPRCTMLACQRMNRKRSVVPETCRRSPGGLAEYGEDPAGRFPKKRTKSLQTGKEPYHRGYDSFGACWRPQATLLPYRRDREGPRPQRPFD